MRTINKTFKEYIQEGKNPISATLITKKSIIKNIDIIKYKGKDRYGILSFPMQEEKRKFLEDNGFKLDRNTHYPYKTYENKKDFLKDLEDIFGIEKDIEVDKFLGRVINESVTTKVSIKLLETNIGNYIKTNKRTPSAWYSPSTKYKILRVDDGFYSKTPGITTEPFERDNKYDFIPLKDLDLDSI